ncbi:FIST signal transduction protein [Desulfopila aestuarii]|uniref:Uncharacterized conserved protein, contains FIST_N domain n=1 Tax=Desulfopila aestuarii DSM 18488 TaxID=1121416 RepID=A0A1M7XWR0_9BACT|nr:FIST C-terminal domain-containing protein [Desulfopila aestuarii]SHO43231.1 Uncharacterized conserved protein, contains FIST_N domain [Desulfopila aestuarii DSM 18488]
MTIYFDPEGTATGLEQCLRQASQDDNISGLLVLSCAANDFTPEAIDPILQQTKVALAGGIFPRIIHNTKLHDKGTLVIGLPDVVTIETIHHLRDPDADFEHILDQKLPDSSEVRTLILLVDGFAPRISSFIESLFNVFGLDFNYVGGGAGSLSMERKPYILTNAGMVMDAAVLTFLSTPSGIGVGHGWQEMSGPYQVTGIGPSAVQTIEWEPAFDFYRKTIFEKTGIHCNRESFFDVSKYHPFGISRLGGEQIIRDPYQVETDGSLVCIGEIQEGAFISIMQAEENHLIEAAAESLRLSLQALPADDTVGLCFFVDCISRVIVLDTNFQKELDVVSTTGQPLVGICSMGEIANSGTDYLELYNKTSVMAVLAKR